MNRSDRTIRWSRIVTLVAFVLSTKGCTCGSSYPKQASGAALQHDAAAVRLSRDLLPYIQNNLQKILTQNFTTDATGEYVFIYLPEASDASANVFCDELGQYNTDQLPRCSYTLRVRDGCIGPGDRSDTGACVPDLGKPRETYRSYLRIKIADLANHFSIDMETPGALDTGGFRIRLTEVPVDLSLGLYVNAALLSNGLTNGHVACLFEKAPGALSSLTIHSLDISVQPRVDNNSGEPTLFATSIVHSLELGDLSVTSSKLATDHACTAPSNGLTCDAVCPLVNDALMLGSEGFNALDDLIAPVLPILATPLANVALAFLWNKPLELGGAIDVGNLGFVPKALGTPLQLLTSAQGGAFAVTQQRTGDAYDPTMGMSIPLSAGAYAKDSACAPYVSPNPYYAAQLPNFTGSVTLKDAKGVQFDENYHVALALSESFLNQAAYAARASGLLCLRAGSSEDGAIATGSFSVNAGLLYLLAPQLETLAPSSAPVFIELDPGDAPIFRLGDTSVMGTDEKGNPQRTSLLNLQLNKIGIEFHVFSYDQYIRVFSVKADIGVGLSLLPQTDGKLSLSIDHLSADNLAVGFNPFMPGLDFTRITDLLFSLLTSALGSGGLSFDLPITQALQKELGTDFQVRVVDIRRDGPDDGVVAAYLKVCAPEDRTDPSNRTCYDAVPATPTRDDAALTVHAAHVGYVPTSREAVRALGADAEPDGSVSLTLSVPQAVQVAVDDAPYGAFSEAAATVQVRSPRLFMLGHHTLHVRTRDAHGRIEVNRTPASADVIVDPERPRLSLASRRIVASDRVTPADKLLFRVGDSRWLAQVAAQVAVDSAAAGTRVVARDEAGNLSEAQFVQGEPSATPVSKHHGCRADGEGSAVVLAVCFYLLSAKRKVSSAR